MGTPGGDAGSWPLLENLSRPGAVLDAEGRIVFLNRRAEAFWGLSLAEVAGRRARDVLGIGPREERALTDWVQAVVVPALERRSPVPVRVVARYGRVHLLEMSGMLESRGGRRYALLMLSEPAARVEDPGAAVDAPLDPATGLTHLHEGSAQHRAWSARGGAAVLFDLDALHETNALYGAAAGDAVLAAAAQALAEVAPPGALPARCGDDELVLLLPPEAAARAEALAAAVVEHLGRRAPVPLAPRLHYGVAAFGPGGMAAAVAQARDRLYERRRALLRARSGGRIVLTREGRAAVQEPGGESRSTAPGAFAANLSAEFDGYFRRAYARAVDQAREFVAFVDPPPESAVVEVGAGSGRIAFDGGLAARVGRGGQLLLTDPSAAQLDVARRRAAELGFDWVRFLCAPVEALPLEPGTADLCLGAAFLHFTEAGEAIRAMARVVRPGGCVALSAVTGVDWPAPWREILEPVHACLATHGLALDLFPSAAALERALHGAGLRTDRRQDTEEPVAFGSVEVAVAVWRQLRFVPLMLRRLPPAACRGVAEAVEERLRQVWARVPAEALTIRLAVRNVVAQREDARADAV